MRTPWGNADQVYTLAEGIVDVSTPSHGGIMVHKRVSTFLSAEALRIADSFGDWLVFEEDCAFAAVYADCPALWRQAQKVAGSMVHGDSDELARQVNGPDAEDDAIRAFFLDIVLVWFPDEYGVSCRWCARGNCYKHNGS